MTRSDARKRLEGDHQVHWDPAVREIVARERAAATTPPAGYFIAPDAFGDIHIWRERGDYPVPVVAYHDFRNDPELWDYLACALPHMGVDQ